MFTFLVRKPLQLEVRNASINKLNGCVANFQLQRLSNYKTEHFDDAAVQLENSYYDPVHKNINECMNKGENV